MAKREKSRVKLAVLAALLLLLLAGAIGVVQLTERLGAGVQPPESSSQPSEIPASSESTQTSEQETSSCAVLVDGEWVDYPCDENPLDWSEYGSSGERTGSSGSGSNSSTTRVTPGPNSSAPRFEFPLPGENPSANDQEQVWCPNDPSENPALYQACWEGFVAPDFVLTGIHSCRAGIVAGGDFDGEPAVEVEVRIELVGGNYRDHNMGGEGREWDGSNKGYTLRSEVWIVYPGDYETPRLNYVDVVAEASFGPMRDSYNGNALVGFQKAWKWIRSPIATSDLPGHCWPPNL